MKKLAIMQPYFLPYIGYFQLISSVDTFIFYDDVNYIKGGWINRNKILLNDKPHLFTIPCRQPSPNKLIKEIEVDFNDRAFKKTFDKINHAYTKAPFKKGISSIIEEIFYCDEKMLNKFCGNSIIKISNYLGLEVDFKYSSEIHNDSKGSNREDRIIEIAKKERAQEYINSFGGKELYDKGYFQEKDINLKFIKSKNDIIYPQKGEEFIPFLSMIDVLMFNSKPQVLNLLGQYEII